jgi:hypothetical protein
MHVADGPPLFDGSGPGQEEHAIILSLRLRSHEDSIMVVDTLAAARQEAAAPHLDPP